MKRFRAAIPLAFLMVAVAASSLEPASLKINVSDQGRAPVARARILLISRSTLEVFTESADAAGNYEFHSITPGEYELRVASSGFGTEAMTIKIAEHLQKTVRVSLKVGMYSGVELAQGPPPEPGNVTVSIRDLTGAGIPNTRLLLIALQDLQTSPGCSDSKGDFTFGKPTFGHFEIMAVAVGFEFSSSRTGLANWAGDHLTLTPVIKCTTDCSPDFVTEETPAVP